MKRVLLSLITLLMPALLLAQTNTPLFSIPFELIDNRPFIKVTVGKRVYQFILDTSAGNAIDKAVADSLHIPLDNATVHNGAGGKPVNFWMVRLDSMRIGSQKLTKPTVQVTDFSEIKEKLNLPYLDGVIGYTFMRDYAVQFDYPHRVINFFQFFTADNGMAFSLYRGQIPRIRVEVDGKSVMVMMDTGDRTAFTLFNHQAEKLNIPANYKLSAETVTGYGLGGPVTARTFTLKKLNIAGGVLKNVATRIPALTTGGFAVTDIDGSIGGGVLKNYKVTIDYLRKKVYLE